jgi:hypothetical protein
LSKTFNEFDPPLLGLMVWGSLYEPRTKDFDGNPIVDKDGKPSQRFEFGLAIPKTQGHFSQEPGWGELIWATGHAAFPGGAQSPAMADDFSWKILDGDSTKISMKSKSKTRPCDREGYKGNWVLTFSSVYAPQILDARDLNKIVPLTTPDAIVPGYFILVGGNVAGNTGKSPGVYLNHAAVALRAYGKIIESRGAYDVGKFGKVTAALPPGASLAPVGVPVALPAAQPSAAVAPAPAAPPPVRVTPAPGLVAVTPAAAPPPPPTAAAPPPSTNTIHAVPMHKGFTVASYLANGWTMDQLRADGFSG